MLSGSVFADDLVMSVTEKFIVESAVMLFEDRVKILNVKIFVKIVVRRVPASRRIGSCEIFLK